MKIITHTNSTANHQQLVEHYKKRFDDEHIIIDSGIAEVDFEEIFNHEDVVDFGRIFYLCPLLTELVAHELNICTLAIPDIKPQILYEDIFTTLNLPIPQSSKTKSLDDTFAEEPYKSYGTSNSLLRESHVLNRIVLNRLALLEHLQELGKTTLKFEFLIVSN